MADRKIVLTPVEMKPVDADLTPIRAKMAKLGITPADVAEAVYMGQKKKITPNQEFKKVLTYPEFALTPKEILLVLEEEVLPYFEVVKVIKEVKGTCRDPEDDLFLSCALASGADFIVTGDDDLLVLKQFQTVRIIKPIEFIHYLE